MLSGTATIAIGISTVSILIGGAMSRMRRSKRLGWAAGIAALVLFSAVILPLHETLERIECEDSLEPELCAPALEAGIGG